MEREKSRTRWPACALVLLVLTCATAVSVLLTDLLSTDLEALAIFALIALWSFIPLDSINGRPMTDKEQAVVFGFFGLVIVAVGIVFVVSAAST